MIRTVRRPATHRDGAPFQESAVHAGRPRYARSLRPVVDRQHAIPGLRPYLCDRRRRSCRRRRRLRLVCLGFRVFRAGTPAPIDAPKKLVVRGLYRYTRNPIYVGVLAVILGWALLFRAAPLVIYALIVGMCFHLFVVLYEERHLRREFGNEYDEYCARVGRWLPRLRRRPAA
jgi:hypothetical protein